VSITDESIKILNTYSNKNLYYVKEKLKYGLTIEVKSCNRRIGQLLRKKYHREMDYVYAVMNEMERKLERPIRDLDDIRMVIETLKKIRENEVDMDLKIEPIEEAFNVLTRYDLPVDREDLELVDNVRYCWQRVLTRAMDMNIYLLDSQPQLQTELAENLKHFKLDCVQYCHEYRTLGPMMPGLSPREASDRLIMFQVNILFYLPIIIIFFYCCIFKCLHINNIFYRIVLMVCGDVYNLIKVGKNYLV